MATATINPWETGLFGNFIEAPQFTLARPSPQATVTMPKGLIILNYSLLLISIFFIFQTVFIFAGLPHWNPYTVFTALITSGGLFFVFHRAEKVIRKKVNG